MTRKIQDGKLWCPDCGEFRPIECFSRYIDRGKERYLTRCKPHESKRQKRWRWENPEKYEAIYQRMKAKQKAKKQTA